MKQKLFCGLIPLLIVLVSGLFVIQVDEQGVVVRFGRVLSHADGEPVILNSGVHWDLPWPFSRVKRINVSRIQTLRISGMSDDDRDASRWLRTTAESSEPQFLTGDRNILDLSVTVQYRVSRQQISQYLFVESNPEQRLKLLAESVVSDLVMRSGVDYVHPLGLAELQSRLTAKCQQLAAEQRLGLEIESVAINDVSPPARVKADFLDVSNARNDKAKMINSAHSYTERRAEESRARRSEIYDLAKTFQLQLIQESQSMADSFRALVRRVDLGDRGGIESARQFALQQRYLETLEAVLSAASGKVMLEGGRMIDLTILKSEP